MDILAILKKEKKNEALRGVIACFAICRIFPVWCIYGIFMVVHLCAPVELLMTCMTVRVIQYKLQRKQATLID